MDSLNQGIARVKMEDRVIHFWGLGGAVSNNCSHDEVCFCSGQQNRCELQTWIPTGYVTWSPARRLLHDYNNQSRNHDNNLEERNMVQVAITFGLKPPDFLPLLSSPEKMHHFDENFE